MKQYLSLADHTFEIEGGKSLSRMMRLEGFGQFAVKNPSQDLFRLELDAKLPRSHQGKQVLFRCNEEALRQRYELGMADECLYFSFSDKYGRYFYMMRPPVPHYLVGSSCFHNEQTRFSLWMAVAMLGSSAGIIPIHASAVIYKGGAILFLGESGTGKSTRSKLWLNTFRRSELLNDDSPLLSVGLRGVEVYGSPWSGKTPCYRNEHYPLTAVVRLARSSSDRLIRLGGTEALSALLPSCPPALAQVPEFLDQTLLNLDRLINHVPVYQMRFRVEPEPSVRPIVMLYNELFGR